MAVGEFRKRGSTELTGDQVRLFSTSVYEKISVAVAPLESEGFRLSVAPPDVVGRVDGATFEQRENAAGRAARSLNADLLITGTLWQEDQATLLEPEIFLSGQKLQYAPELSGLQRFGPILRVDGDIIHNAAVRKDLRELITSRVESLTEFILGLSYYGSGRYDKAETHFIRAEGDSGSGADVGNLIYSVFLGNTRGKLGDFAGARRYYEEALALQEGYVRARLGLAELLYHQARGSCESGTSDAPGLRQALDQFHSIVISTNTSIAEEERAKASFGMGRVYLCLSQSLIEDRWQEAELSLSTVVGQYEAGTPSLRAFASEAEAGLGLISLPPPGAVASGARYQSAAAHFQRSISLARPGAARADLYALLGFAYSHAGRFNDASPAYENAIRLTTDESLKSQYQDDLRASQNGRAPEPPPHTR